jgi:phage shock protein PspC (stress-responsive transcriptional regulator)
MRHRWLGGVCSGFARFIGLDILPVRLLIRFLFVTMVPMFWWVYLILWAVLPAQKLYDEAPGAPAARPERKEKPIYSAQVRVEVKRVEAGDVVENTRGKVSDRVFERVVAIDRLVRTLRPSLTWWRTLTQPEFATVKRAALEYFPQTLQHYLHLPRDYAENHRLADGMTPEQKLLDDLQTLERTLNKVLESVVGNERVNVPDDLRRLSERYNANEPEGDDLARSLEDLVTRTRGRVPDDIHAKVVSIRATILSVLPQITELGAGMTQESFNLRQTAREYLPDALEKYMSLPPGFAETHVLSNGKTAQETLLEQLELLDSTVKDIVGDVYEADADALVVHGRFLKEKFADSPFSLPGLDGERSGRSGTSPASDGIRFPDLGGTSSERKPEPERLKRGA